MTCPVCTRGKLYPGAWICGKCQRRLPMHVVEILCGNGLGVAQRIQARRYARWWLQRHPHVKSRERMADLGDCNGRLFGVA